ncbi:MAG TPA: hypothetical protein VLE23_17125 [Geminicoccaceae bacterium]|nr:hypothetical protein [Geminicoccaceae bacterium]
MFEPLLELMLDAIDTGLTVVVLLALWDGRAARASRALARWLRRIEKASDLDGFLRDARGLGRETGHEIRGAATEPGV